MLWFLCIAMVNTHFLNAHTYTRNFLPPISISHPFFFFFCDKNNYKKFHISQLLTRHKNNEFPPPLSHTHFHFCLPLLLYLLEKIFSQQGLKKMKGSKKKMKKNLWKLKLSNFNPSLLCCWKHKRKKHWNGIRGRKFVDGACAVYRLRQFQWVTCECDIDLCAFVKHIDQKSFRPCSDMKCLPVPIHMHV